MSKIGIKVKEEIRELIPATIFFFLALHLVVLVRELMLEGSGIRPQVSVSILIAALLLAKAVLLSDLLPFMKHKPGHPLLVIIAIKSSMYLVAATVIHYLERLIEVWREVGTFAAANEKLLHDIIWPQFWAMHLVLCVLLVTYCTIRELARVLGTKQMVAIFLGHGSAPHA